MENNTLKSRKLRQTTPNIENKQTVIENLKTKTHTKNNINIKKSKENDNLSFISKNIFMIILTVRTISVCFNLIWDCDEVYNYWEPLHFILFGNGFQTWEYSPEYSLRSYLYIYLHAIPIWSFKWIVSSKITLFYMLRFFLAFVASKIETYLFHSILEVTAENKNYSNIAYFYMILSLTNAGMFLSVTSFLPSTFSMYLVMLAYAAGFKNSNSKLAIFSIGLAVILGWPFVAILGVPIAIDMCYSTNIKDLIKKLIYFKKWTIIFGLLITIPSVLFDSYYFGKIVFASLNIVMYNVFPSNPNQGPDLYGTEPLSFYFLNGLLNFNVLFVLIWLAVIFLFAAEHFYEDSSKDNKKSNSMKINKKFRTILFALALWFLVFFTRPHKEERFLYPVYPLILITASVSINFIQLGINRLMISSNLIFDIRIKKIYKNVTSLIFIIHAVISLMRVIALFKNFSSSIEIYEILNKPEIKFQNAMLDTKEKINVCVQKEWYRFPSSFFIPENLNENVKKQEWRLRFLESSFKGQLPGNYNENLSFIESTRHIDSLFNDENKEVRERYVKIKNCDFFIDTDTIREDDSGITELKFYGIKSRWKTLVSLPFIDMNPETNSDRFLKAFYVPYYYESKVRITFFKLRIRIP